MPPRDTQKGLERFREMEEEAMFANRVRDGVVVGLALAVLLCGGCTQSETVAFLDVSGPYLGEEPPGETPVLFAPGIVSTNTRDWSMASTPDGGELFFGISSEEIAFILHT
jgi:hypothetical protein